MDETQPNTTLLTTIAREKTPISRYVLQVFNQANDPRLVYHNYAFAEKLGAAAFEISTQNNYEKKVTQLCQIAAYLYPTGFLFNYKKPKIKTLEIAEQFMRSQEIPLEFQSEIFEALKVVFDHEISRSRVAQVLNDAVASVYFDEQFLEQNPLLRLEKELLLQQRYSKGDWTQFQLQELLRTTFFTPFGKITFEPVLAKNILAQKQLAEKNSNDISQPYGDEKQRKFQNLEKKLPGSATQTFFRTNYRNHINLSSIADGKANIMISVNAILISVIISAVSYRNIIETQPEILMPAIIFVVTGLTSLVFAVLSARPKVTSVTDKHLNLGEAKRNLVFFGNFVHLDLPQYEEAMDAMFRDSELIYGNMTRDLYYLGQVLHKKYRYLTISYNVFMVGFVATVLTFLMALFF